MSQQYPFQCNIAQALNIIGDKWSLLILHGIMSGHQTYKEIYNSLEGADCQQSAFQPPESA